ncbi:MAG: rhamnulokinase [Firmicutes bacterium]|nr:rhamnulokinase [Bacillota bacterium]
MSSILKVLALDLGAESGRAVLGKFDGEGLSLEEVHRFPNEPVRIPDGLHWDVLRLFHEMKRGLGLAMQKHGKDLAGLGVDTWGVDFGLLGRGDVLLGNPHHYRDHRTDGAAGEVFKILPQDEIFRRTGIQFMQINTIFQLWAMKRSGSPILEMAETLLMLPDLFNFLFTGKKASEFTIATTSELYDPTEGDWSRAILDALGLPGHIFTHIVQPGTVIGPLGPWVAREIGAGGEIPVIAPAGHDTACAVAAVPARQADYVYISSGTWSLVGVEVTRPVINELTMTLNFTNEGGVAGTFRLLKNVTGLWLVQQCRRAWERAGEALTYDQITEMARRARPLASIIDPDCGRFLSPEDMPSEIQRCCEETGQPVPQTRGEIVRCALDSLALKYRWVVERLEDILGRKLPVIHIVGGGTKNTLLCQLAANATGRPVIAGPVEATAIGNSIMQAMALGYIRSIAEAREMVRRSFPLRAYEPVAAERGAWDDAYERFLKLLEACAT